MLARSLQLLSFLTFGISTALAQAGAPGQSQTPSSPVTLTGCVTAAKDKPGAYVFTNDSMCAEIEGKFDAKKALGHTVTFRGLVTPPANGEPKLFKPQKLLSVGPECSATCHIAPPPGRGVHRRHMGAAGSTNGLQPHSNPQ